MNILQSLGRGKKPVPPAVTVQEKDDTETSSSSGPNTTFDELQEEPELNSPPPTKVAVANAAAPSTELKARNKGLVKFPSTKEKMEEIRRRSSISNEQLDSLWLNYREFCDLRTEVQHVARETKDKGYSKLLTVPKDDENMAQMRLDMWAKVENDLNLRGLERQVNSEHKQWRDEERARTRRAVLEAQEYLREDREFEDFSDYLAMISSRNSERSKMFARMMAKADEKAARKGTRLGAVTTI